MKLTANVVALALLVGVALAGGLLGGCGKDAPAEIKIGCITPLTGENANYGKQTKAGVDLAVEQINARGGIGGKKLVVVYEDDQMNAKVGTDAIQKLISVEKVPVILGAFGSRVTLAIAPIAERSKVVLFSASSTADAIADAGDYIFRNVPPNAGQGTTAAHFCQDALEAKTACVLQVNDDYGRSLGDAFVSAFKEKGQVLSVETYSPGVKDYRTQLTRIRGQAPDVVFCPSYYQEMGLILKQAKELGIEARFISGDGAVDPQLVTLAGNAAEGSYYTMMGIPLGSPAAAKFETDYEKKYGEKPGVYAAYAYDATMIIADAISRGGYTADGVKQALYDTTGYSGVTGITSFDARGEVRKPYAVFEVRNGDFEPLPWTL